jgi:hypothetical protein
MIREKRSFENPQVGSRRSVVALLVLLFMTASVNPAKAGEIVAAAQTERNIDAPAEIVFDILLDRSLWMDSFVSQELVSGAEGQLGAVYRVTSRFGDAIDVRHERVLGLIDDRVYVVELFPVDSTEQFTAIVYFEIEPLTGHTSQLSMRVAFRQSGANVADGSAEQRALSEEARRSTQDKIDTDMTRLRQVAEAQFQSERASNR